MRNCYIYMSKKLNLLTFCFIFLCYTFSFGQVPKNLEECNDFFDKDLKAEDIEYIKSLTFDRLSVLHFTLGLNIRNIWIYGDRNPELVDYFHYIGIFHPDGISTIIIKSYWSYLNKHEFDLEGEIKYYQDYWEKAAEIEKQEMENVANTNMRLSSAFINITYKKSNPPLLTLPQNKNGIKIFSDEFIEYKNGYIINSVTTSTDLEQGIGVDYEYHYVDLKNNKLFKLHFSCFDTVESLIAIDSTLFICGIKSHKLKIVKHDGNKILPISMTVLDNQTRELRSDSWTKLGVFEGKLFALQTNGLYMFNGDDWQLINKFNLSDYSQKSYPKSYPIIPTENIVIANNKLYFLQEVLQGRDCELFELDLKTNTISEFWQKSMLADNYDKDVNSYSLIGNDTLFVAAQILGETLLLSVKNNTLTVYLLDNKVKEDVSGDCKIFVRKVLKCNDKLLIIADNGLFELKNKEITPIAFFANTEQVIQDGKYKFHFNFIPRSCAILNEDKYLIGGQYGGLYIFDIKNNTIISLDDNIILKKMDLLKD
jgi:hypothetical protein